jgi:cytochrome c oxidase cbb3-type subunit I/II
MPSYAWMLRNRTDYQGLSRRMKVLAQTGVPYTTEQIGNAASLAQAQAKKISDNLVSQGGPRNLEDKEVVALIAYLQRLGKAAAAPAPAPEAPAAAPAAAAPAAAAPAAAAPAAPAPGAVAK